MLAVTDLSALGWRPLAVAWSSGATPVVVLTKADLCEDVEAVVEQVREEALGVNVVAVSSVTGEGLDAVRDLLPAGRTGAMVGPSGVGKSRLVNALAWRKLQAEAHRQLLRVDARARAAEKARLRSFHRAIREQPDRLR